MKKIESNEELQKVIQEDLTVLLFSAGARTAHLLSHSCQSLKQTTQNLSTSMSIETSSLILAQSGKFTVFQAF
ncbi:hypothetical protein BsIDN1_52470 [Bacillus safensis]|uniref:Uncharacterized protein n=1 Tax=Bacillus safensis TaxID=561879 RepID=A0A5S9MII8_BACIA|nr:hypothetical protein BsIDN1_52470 [Bacillus safensis]